MNKPLQNGLAQALAIMKSVKPKHVTAKEGTEQWFLECDQAFQKVMMDELESRTIRNIRR